MWEWLIPAILGLVGAILGGLISPLIVARIQYAVKKQEVVKRAIVSVKKAQSLRWAITSVTGIQWLSDEEKSSIGSEARKQAVLEFISAMNEARHSLSEVTIRNELATWNVSDGWEITEESAVAILRELRSLI